MPLYELFCLAKPRLGKAVLGDIIKLAARTVLDKGGVITDIKSFGEQKLAYEIRRPGEKYEEVSARSALKISSFCVHANPIEPFAGDDAHLFIFLLFSLYTGCNVAINIRFQP